MRFDSKEAGEWEHGLSRGGHGERVEHNLNGRFAEGSKGGRQRREGWWGRGRHRKGSHQERKEVHQGAEREHIGEQQRTCKS